MCNKEKAVMMMNGGRLSRDNVTEKHLSGRTNEGDRQLELGGR